MDRAELSAAIIQDVGEIVAADLRAAGPELLAADLDGMEMRLHAMSRRVCGATMERVCAVQAAPQGERPPCPVCGVGSREAGAAPDGCLAYSEV